MTCYPKPNVSIPIPKVYTIYGIRESVDSLCSDGTDAQYMQYFKLKPYNITTNMLKAYLSTQCSPLSAFTHVSAQKPRGNAKVCSSKSAIFLILVKTTKFNSDISKTVKFSLSFYHKTDSYHSAELYNHSASS